MGIIEKALNLFRGTDAATPACKPGRNDACWCGSGKKYKKCHMIEDEKKAAKDYTVNCGPT